MLGLLLKPVTSNSKLSCVLFMSCFILFSRRTVPRRRYNTHSRQPSALGKRLSVFCSIGYAMVSCDVTVSMLSAPKQLHHAP